MVGSIRCPYCSAALQIPEGVRYTSIECPKCRQKFSSESPSPPNMELGVSAAPPKPPATADTEIPSVIPVSSPPTPPPLPPQAFTPQASSESIPEVLPVEPILEGPVSEAVSYARAAGIDPYERFTEEVQNESAAQRVLQQWKVNMPEVNSAYHPSGVLPVSALGLMICGAAAALAAAVLAELLVGALAAGVLAILTFCNALALFGGFIYCFWVVVMVIALIVALVSPFAAGGWAAAWTTTRFGRWGKNRNATAAVLFSVLSAGISIPIVSVLFVAFAKSPLDELRLFGLQPGSLDVAYWIIAGIGGLVAVVTAWYVALTSVEAAKFCEECEQYMDKQKIKWLCFGASKAILRALSEQKPQLALQLLDTPFGGVGEVLLFSCPKCAKGYLEILVHFTAHWHEKTYRLFKPKEKYDLKETWLAASTEMAPVDVQSFQAWVKSN